MPVKGLNLFSRSNCCFPRTPRSTCRSGQIAYSSIVLLIWKILSVIASGAGPGNRTANSRSFCIADMKIQRTQSSSTNSSSRVHLHECIIQAAKYQNFLKEYMLMIIHAEHLIFRYGKMRSISFSPNRNKKLSC